MSEHVVDDAERDDALMDHRSTIVVAGAMLTGLVLRLVNLGTQPLWLDEAATVANVRVLREHGLAALAQADHMPPLSFAIQMISTTPVMNEVTLRFPSALAGVLAILFVHLAALRVTGSPTVGAWAAVFMAVSPFAVWYSQEARMYSFLILLAAIYVWVCWPALSRDLSPLRALSILLVTVAGLYVHHYFALLMLVMGCWLVIKLTPRSRVLWWWLLAQALASLAFVPWLVLSMTRAAAGAGFEKAGEALWLPYTFYTFVAGLTLGPSTADIRLLPTREWLSAHWLALVVPFLAVVALSGALLQARRAMSRGTMPWLLWWLAGPPLLAFVFSLALGVGYNARYTAVAFPACAILVGCAVERIRVSWWSRVAAMLLTIVACWSLVNWYTNPHYSKEDVRSVAAFAAQNMAPGDRVVIYSHTARLPLDYYGWACGPDDLIVRGPDGAAAVAEALTSAAIPGRTWVVQYRPWESDPDGTVERALRDAGASVAVTSPGVSVQRLDHLIVVPLSEQVEPCPR